MNDANDMGGTDESERFPELEARYDGYDTVEAPAITLDEINYEYALRQMAGGK